MPGFQNGVVGEPLAARCGFGSPRRGRGKPADLGGHDPARQLIPACAGKTGGRPVRGFGFWARPRVCGENLIPTGALTPLGGSSPRVRGKPPKPAASASSTGLIPACAGKTGLRSALRKPTRAHPRVCGENRASIARATSTLGSSPRVRGKRDLGAPLRERRGLIPACAGKTGRRTSRRSRTTAHPRVCGENDTMSPGEYTRAGSSPRVRGKRRHSGDRGLPVRLIPACAGKTGFGGGRSRRWRAHPRVCGENAAGVYLMYRRRGSSPRVRGKRAGGGARGGACGLIPACAGKTLRSWWTCTTRTAHPRVCGENLDADLESVSPQGSSPRVRGKREVVIPASLVPGLIPACAGKTQRESGRAPGGRAHPRVCGENLGGAALKAGDTGSSPRVRGKRVSRLPGDDRARLIPACAGKTRCVCCAWPACRAHRRVCGENLIDNANPLMGMGSSPRVRGKLEALPAFPDEHGLIPACAGKTRL